ncbi:hypothetical protein GCM10020218_030400 [Dactylosporangium vinaceum]
MELPPSSWSGPGWTASLSWGLRASTPESITATTMPWPSAKACRRDWSYRWEAHGTADADGAGCFGGLGHVAGARAAGAKSGALPRAGGALAGAHAVPDAVQTVFVADGDSVITVRLIVEKPAMADKTVKMDSVRRRLRMG